MVYSESDDSLLFELLVVYWSVVSKSSSVLDNVESFDRTTESFDSSSAAATSFTVHETTNTNAKSSNGTIILDLILIELELSFFVIACLLIFFTSLKLLRAMN